MSAPGRRKRRGLHYQAIADNHEQEQGEIEQQRRKHIDFLHQVDIRDEADRKRRNQYHLGRPHGRREWFVMNQP